MSNKMMCNTEDVTLGFDILERKIGEDELDAKAEELYGEDFNPVEVPFELFRRMLTEIHHHRALSSNPDAGLLLTLRGSTSGEGVYGASKNLRFEFGAMLQAPDVANFTDEELENVHNCCMEAWGATLRRELEQLKAEVADVLNRKNTN